MEALGDDEAFDEPQQINILKALRNQKELSEKDRSEKSQLLKSQILFSNLVHNHLLPSASGQPSEI